MKGKAHYAHKHAHTDTHTQYTRERSKGSEGLVFKNDTCRVEQLYSNNLDSRRVLALFLKSNRYLNKCGL